MSKRKLTDMLLRLYSVVQEIPGAHIGVSIQSASILGVVTFAKDMNAIKQPLQKILYHLRIEEYEEADELLRSLEAWAEMRKAVDWQDVFPFPLPR